MLSGRGNYMPYFLSISAVPSRVALLAPLHVEVRYTSAIRYHLSDCPVYEVDLGNNCRCEYKGIQIRLPHAAIETVECVGERQPLVNNRIE